MAAKMPLIPAKRNSTQPLPFLPPPPSDGCPPRRVDVNFDWLWLPPPRLELLPRCLGILVIQHHRRYHDAYYDDT